jgi:hypothetical protein
MLFKINFMRTGFYVLLFSFYFCLQTNAQYFINVESGAVFAGLNTIRNGSAGTLLSLKNDLKSPVSPFLRLRIGILHKEKHPFSILYASLKLVAKRRIASDITFDGKNYEANIPLEAVYKFNSYRFTYNRRIINSNAFKLGIGLSAKTRDAGSSLKNKNEFSRDFSIGFVPFINVLSTWQVSKKFSVDFFGAGLAATKGRAIDVALTETYHFTKKYKVV